MRYCIHFFRFVSFQATIRFVFIAITRCVNDQFNFHFLEEKLNKRTIVFVNSWRLPSVADTPGNFMEPNLFFAATGIREHPKNGKCDQNCYWLILNVTFMLIRFHSANILTLRRIRSIDIKWIICLLQANLIVYAQFAAELHWNWISLQVICLLWFSYLFWFEIEAIRPISTTDSVDVTVSIC